MNFMPTKWIKRDFLIVIIFLQLMVYMTVFFDIPIARQVIGFFYFTFIPGFAILKLLKLDKFDWVETILFAVGLSIAFLMITGLLINGFGLLLGVSQPLSVVPLMIILNSLVLMGGVLVYLRRENVEICKSEPIEKSPLVLLFLCLPILSIVGAMYVNAYGNNMLLLFMIISISMLFTVGILSKKVLPPKLYPFAVIMIAISLLYHSSLISNYLVSFGSDIGIEYYVFKITQNSARWSSTLPSSLGLGYGRFNAMLSVTILPTIYSNLLNIDPTWPFKMLFPLIFSLVPLGLYQVWQAYIGKKYAFISTFLFMAQMVFYTEMLGLMRQMVAELFFVLLLLAILNKKMKPFNKMMCFMIFSIALVISHYALAEIFFFFISSALIFLVVLKRPRRNITVSMVVFFFVVMFTWYIYTAGSAVFDSFLSFGDNVYNQLGDFFNPASRGQTVLQGLGLEAAPTIWNTISRAFAYITQAFIVVGFVGLILKRTKTHFERDYFVICSAAMALLVALILVPGLANTLNMTRFYHTLLFFLAPFCVMGAAVIVKLMLKQEKELVVSLLLLIVLAPYFLFQTGFVYEVTGSESWSVPLSSYRMDGYKLYGEFGYIDDFGVFAAEWMREKIDVRHTQIYADLRSRLNELVPYRSMYEGYVFPLSNVTEVPINGTVYLNPLNIVYKIIVTDSYVITLGNLSFLEDMSKIYSNGKAEIYRNNTGN